MNPDEWESLGGFLHYMTRSRQAINTACPVCKREFNPEDPVLDLRTRGTRFLVHAACLRLSEQGGQLVGEPIPPAPPAQSLWPFWPILAGLALLVVGGLVALGR